MQQKKKVITYMTIITQTEEMEIVYILQSTYTENYLFVKQTDVCIAFRNTSIMYDILKLKTPYTTNENTKSGIYKLICSTCKRPYVGQTGRNLKQSYLEHMRYIRNNDTQSAYKTQILHSVHKQYVATQTREQRPFYGLLRKVLHSVISL